MMFYNDYKMKLILSKSKRMYCNNDATSHYYRKTVYILGIFNTLFYVNFNHIYSEQIYIFSRITIFAIRIWGQSKKCNSKVIACKIERFKWKRRIRINKYLCANTFLCINNTIPVFNKKLHVQGNVCNFVSITNNTIPVFKKRLHVQGNVCKFVSITNQIFR